MRDYLTLSVKETEFGKKLVGECSDASEESGKSLLIKAEATHSGIVNGNQRFYRPDRMQDSVYRWTEANKPLKPVLVEHDKEGSTIGRVHTAKYFDLSHLYRDEVPEISNMLFFADAATKRLDLFKSVNLVLDKLQTRDDYRGLGYIELGMKITNPDAIRKVLSDEYLTVSVGFSTDQAICSACHTDWAADDRCEHKLGEMVDGKKMFLIAGNFFYKECSFVNFPADPFAQVISKEVLNDSLLNKIFFLGLPSSRQKPVIVGCDMTDSVELSKLYESDIQVIDSTEIEEHKMLADLQSYLDEMNKAPLTKERAKEILDKVQALVPAEDAEKDMKRRVVTTLKSHMQKHNLDVENKKELTKDQVEAKIETLIPTLQDMSVEARKNYVARITEEAKQFELEVPAIDVESLETYQDWKLEDLPAEERDQFADPEKHYAELAAEIDAAKAAGEITDAEMADAKLSTEKRKKLKGGSFCGPNRSFPVPDCAHVTAARRLIGRAKVGESTKSRILSCVSRKAKAMGCGGKKDSVPAPVEQTDSLKTLLDSLHKIEMFTFDDAKIPADTLKCMDMLHGHYSAADEMGKGAMRYGLYSHLTNWRSASEKDYALGQVKEMERENKDSVIEGGAAFSGSERSTDGFTDATKAPLMTVGAGVATEKGKGWVPVGTADSYQALHKAHAAADSEGKSHISGAAGALLEHWHSGSILEYHRSLMAPGTGQVVKDGEIVLTKEEHDTLMTGQERLETQLATTKAETDALQQQNVILVKNLKKDRATTIVAVKVLTGETGYQGLTPDQINDKISQLAQRNLDSLRDSLEDGLVKLDGFVPQGGSSASKTSESDGKQIDDKSKLQNPDAPTNVQDSTTEKPARKLPKDPRARAGKLFFEEKVAKLNAPKE